MDVFRLAVALHDRFGVDIPEKDYRQLLSLEGGCQSLLGERGAGALKSVRPLRPQGPAPPARSGAEPSGSSRDSGLRKPIRPADLRHTRRHRHEG